MMFDTWDEDLSVEESDQLIRKVAREIKKRKLELPAILFAESHKPLSYIGGQAAVFFAPFLVPIVGYANVRDYSRLLNQRDCLDRLMAYLEGPMEALDEIADVPSGPTSGANGGLQLA